MIGRRVIVAASVAAALAVPLACGDSEPTTSTTTPAVPATTTTTAVATTATTAAPTTVEEALAGFAFGDGVRYAGDCAATDLEEDVGAWCATLFDDRGATRIYGAGPTFSEYTTWLLLVEGSGGWAVEDSASAGSLDDPRPAPW